MYTYRKVNELLLPGNWDQNKARELLEEVADELYRYAQEHEVISEVEPSPMDDPPAPTEDKYKRLADAGLFMTIGGVKVVWEKIEAVEPYDSNMTRATIWIDGDTWNDHVKLTTEKR